MAMVEYASRAGTIIPAEVLEVVDRARVAQKTQTSPGDGLTLVEIGACHGRLTRLVAPANPATILLLKDEAQEPWHRFIGATMYARVLWVLALVTFICFIVVLGINVQVKAPSAVMQLALTAVASLVGSVFYVLTQANRQLRAGTFDSRQEGNLSSFIVLGVLSGTTLAYLVVQQKPSASASDAVVFTRPLLGLLGGFAVEVVYRILQRLVAAVQTLVAGSAEDAVKAQKRLADARALEETLANRAEVVGGLIKINNMTDALTPAARAEVQKLIDQLLPTVARGSGHADPDPDPAAGGPADVTPPDNQA
jgi:hypothetical protein